MPDSQYDKPKTLRDADRNIASIQRGQQSLRSQGRHVEAAELAPDLAEQQQARQDIKQKVDADLGVIFRSTSGDN